jgi:hypothetical protein
MSFDTLQFQSAAIGDYIMFSAIIVIVYFIQVYSRNRKKAEADRKQRGEKGWESLLKRKLLRLTKV